MKKTHTQAVKHPNEKKTSEPRRKKATDPTRAEQNYRRNKTPLRK